MLRIVKSFLTIAVVAAIAVGATGAYFSDEVNSIGNTFTAGTLELNVDGAHNNVVKFNATNMKPGSQLKGSYVVANVGSINGYLDVESIVVTDTENGCNAAESLAGDVTCDNPGVGQGELSQVVNLRLFIDRDGDGWIGAGDTVFYNGKVTDLPTSFELNELIGAGGSTKIVALLDWWSTSSDNLAQNDTMQLDMTFELAQTTGQ